MKKILILTAFALVFASSAQAQLIDVNTGASVNANVNVGKVISASTTDDVSATATTKRNDKATTTKSNDNGVSSATSSKANSPKENRSTTTASSAVSLEAREIRGWSEAEKSDFLLTVKSHAELQSGQDLENFAKGVLVSDNNVDAVVADDDSVEVSYKLPAKFLGVFRAEIDAMTNVSFDTEKAGNGPKEVSVKFPWYRLFFSLDADAREDVIESAIASSITSSSSASATVSARNGKAIQLISSVLKGIRASVDAEATATIE